MRFGRDFEIAISKEKRKRERFDVRVDLVGKRFGRLVVLSYSHTDKKFAHWDVLCDCGNTRVVRGSNLKRGRTKSCGCLHKEITSTRSKKMVGPLSSRWNHGLTDEERLDSRKHSRYIDWRKAVYERDNYTCQKCGICSSGSLNAHHIEGYANNPELRTELSNGATLCKDCHKDYHHLHGYNHATRVKFEEWIDN